MTDATIFLYSGDRLQGGRCAHCKALSFPADTLCRECLSEDMAPYLLPRTGTLYSFTLVHRKDGVPVAFGYADLSDGLRVFGRIEGDANPILDSRVSISARSDSLPLCRIRMEDAP